MIRKAEIQYDLVRNGSVVVFSTGLKKNDRNAVGKSTAHASTHVQGK
jgi:hypothetical protein